MKISEEKFYAGQLKALTLSQKESGNPRLPVTALKLSDGFYHVKSRYGDNQWFLPDALFPSNRQPCNKVLNFEIIPKCFQSALKSCILRYYLAGMEGGKRPRGQTIFRVFYEMGAFLVFLAEADVTDLRCVTHFHSRQYIDHCRKLKNNRGKTIVSGTIAHRLFALEILHQLSQKTSTPMPHPWPESSAAFIAGTTGAGHYLKIGAQTQIIPDQVIAPFFQECVARLEMASELIKLQNRVLYFKRQGKTAAWVTRRCQKDGLDLRRLSYEIDRTVDACIVIILDTSGIRVGELASLDVGCTYTQVKDGERYFWMRGISTKLGHGPCEWMVAEVTHKAIAIAEALTEPIREELNNIINEKPLSAEKESMAAHRQAIFLGKKYFNGRISRLSNMSIRNRINILAKFLGVRWRFAPHQFRRTFAVYVSHSALGDIRYLREHFKHWSLDMTAHYAMNQRQDAELYDEIGHALHGIQIGNIEHWLENGTILAGGGSEAIKTFRAGAFAAKSSRREMAEHINPLIHIRATGVGWCLADTGGCAGGAGVERTRCGDCNNSVIEKKHEAIWRGIYQQQIELREIDDIGESGKQRVERDIQRAKQVLLELGASLADLIDER